MPADRLRVGLLAADLTHRHGWAHYSLSILEALRHAGVEVTVLTSRNGPLEADASSLRLLPTVEPREPGMLAALIQTVPAARRALAGCNVIHCAVELYAPLAALVAGNRPLITTGHGTYVRLPARRGAAGLIYRRAFRRGTLACVSHYTARQAEIALPGVRTVVIPNGIDAERFTHLPPAEKDGHTVLFVGAIKSRKGVLALVEAMALVRQEIPGARCWIVGATDQEPAYVDQVRSAIHKLDLSEAVEMLGRIPHDDLMRRYAAADVFALPSLNISGRFEGFGLALLEASAAGLPVIGSRDCGAEDAVLNGKTGLLITQENAAQDLTAAIVRLLKDPDLRASMGAAGRGFAQSQTWDAAATSLIELYESRLYNRR
ncbi:MAG: glycosyltransferase family 4 protein [Anaerolineae bacterium]